METLLWAHLAATWATTCAWTQPRPGELVRMLCASCYLCLQLCKAVSGRSPCCGHAWQLRGLSSAPGWHAACSHHQVEAVHGWPHEVQVAAFTVAERVPEERRASCGHTWQLRGLPRAPGCGHDQVSLSHSWPRKVQATQSHSEWLKSVGTLLWARLAATWATTSASTQPPPGKTAVHSWPHEVQLAALLVAERVAEERGALLCARLAATCATQSPECSHDHLH